MSPSNGMPRIYPWQWMKMWYQFSLPGRYNLIGKQWGKADSDLPTAWDNQKFLKEHPLDMERLRCPQSNESLLVVSPEELQCSEVCDEVRAALRRRDRIVLFKSFFADEEELLDWGREPAKHFENKPYIFDVPAAEHTSGEALQPQGMDPDQCVKPTWYLRTSGAALQSQWMDLFPALEKMAAGVPMYLGFSVTLAQNNPTFRAHLERILLKIVDLLPPKDDIRRCYTHSFLYHGNKYQALLHQATTPDFSFQIANSKYWRFVMHKWSPLMRAIPLSGVPGVWLSKHELIHHSDIPFEEVLAEPGDILFFPEHLWHEVHNVEEGPGLMCGLRSQYSKRKIIEEVLKREHISRSLAWHKFSSLISLKFTKPNMDRPEFQSE